jgi:hypothetical protein
MRYLTRERLLLSQDDIGIVEEDNERELRLAAAAREWKTANSEYNSYILRNRTLLPPALQYLSNCCLHDAVVVSAVRHDEDVELTLKFGEAIWFPKNVSQLLLSFRGVVFESGLTNALRQWMLYTEIHIAPKFFEFSALLQETELTLKFQEVTIRTIPREGPERRPPLLVE